MGPVMTLQQYASIAEIAGVVLIIASLIYVARQVRQNTEMMRVSASSEWLQRDFDISNPVIENRDVAEFWVKGALEFNELDDVDQQRLMLFERRAFSLWHHLWQLRDRGLYSDSDWENMQLTISHFGQRASARSAWSSFRATYGERFQQFLDNAMTRKDATKSQ